MSKVNPPLCSIRLLGIYAGVYAALLTAAGPGPILAAELDPSNSSIQYTGRWSQSDPTAPWALFKGSSIFARFDGTSFSVRAITDGSEYYRIIVDGDTVASTKRTLRAASQRW